MSFDFVHRLNYDNGAVMSGEQAITLINGIYDDDLAHTNIIDGSIEIYTGANKTGTQITDFTITESLDNAYYKHLYVEANYTTLYVSFSSYGDLVMADDINELQDAINTNASAIASGFSDVTDDIDKLSVFVTPEMYGAVADGVTDDTAAIQSAIDNGDIVVMNGDYATTDTIVINKNMRIFHRGTLKYSGSDSAVKFTRVTSVVANLGNITANTGNCIEFYASTYDSEGEKNRCQYVDLSFEALKANTTNGKCIYFNLDVESGLTASGVGWVNEIRIFNGRFTQGAYGVYGDAKGYQKNNNIKIYNTGIEGVSTGIYMANDCRRWSFNNMRYAENFDTLMETVGSVSDFAFYGAQTVNFSGKCNFSNQTYGIFRVPIYSDGVLVTGEQVVNAGVISGNTVYEAAVEKINKLAIENTVSCTASEAVVITDGSDGLPISTESTGAIAVYGKNLCPEASVSLTRSVTRTYTITDLPAVTGDVILSWTYEGELDSASYGKVQITMSDGSKNAVNVSVGTNQVTIPSDVTLKNIYIFINSTASEGNYMNITNLMLEGGTTASAYKAYIAPQTREAGATTELYTNKGGNTFICGVDSDITYTADTKLYIQSLLG